VIGVASHHPRQTANDRLQLGRTLERNAQVCILTADQVGLELDYEPYHQMLDGFRETRRGHVIPDRITAIEQALSLARPGDSVLISGCGERSIATIGDGEWRISDRDVCQAWLYDESRGETAVSPKGGEAGVSPRNQNIFRIDDYRN
jgi:UDP-N-acetylmuramoyl-L-alanyl-D-glutamate--2,6-diaminopimelate ligase